MHQSPASRPRDEAAATRRYDAPLGDRGPHEPCDSGGRPSLRSWRAWVSYRGLRSPGPQIVASGTLDDCLRAIERLHLAVHGPLHRARHHQFLEAGEFS